MMTESVKNFLEAKFYEFEIEHSGDKYVVKGHQGRTVGTHNTRKEAEDQIAAIYASGYQKD